MANGGNDFNLDLDGLSALQNLMQGVHLEGQNLNNEASLKGNASFPMSAEEKDKLRRQKNNDRAKARRMAKKAGFNSVKEHQAHLDKVNSMFSDSRENYHAVQEEHINQLQLIKNMTKPINMPIDGAAPEPMSENVEDDKAQSAVGALQQISQINFKRNQKATFKAPNLAIPEQQSTALAAISNNYKSTRGIPIPPKDSNLAVNPIPIARPVNYPNPTYQMNGTTSKALTGSTSVYNNPNNQSISDVFENAASKSEKDKERRARAGGKEGQQNTRPWWEKMQDTLEDIRDDVRKLIELSQRHGRGQSFQDIQRNIKGDSDGNSGGLLSQLGPLLMTIGAMTVAKFGSAAAGVLNGAAQIAAKAMSRIDGFVSGATNTVKQAESGVASFIKGGVENLGKDFNTAKNVGSSLMATLVNKDSALMHSGENIFNEVENAGKSNFTRAGEAAAGIVNKIRSGGESLGKTLSNIAGKVTPSISRVTASVAKGPLGFVGGALHKVGQGATALVGAEAAYQGYKSVEDFRSGDTYHGTISALKAGSDYMGAGGKKGITGAIGGFGRRVVTASAIEAASGGPVNPLADVGALATMIGGSFALDKTANYLSTKNGKQTFDSIQNSQTFKDASSMYRNASKLVGGGILGSVVGAGSGALGATFGVGQDIGNTLLNKLNDLFHPKNNLSDLHEKASQEHVNRMQSASQKAQATANANNAVRQSGNSNVTHVNTTNINIARADVTSPDAAKKLLQDALKKQMQVQAQQQKAQEKHSTPAQTNIFGTIQNGVSSLVAQIL